MNAPCVLASHSPITPSQRVIIQLEPLRVGPRRLGGSRWSRRNRFPARKRALFRRCDLGLSRWVWLPPRCPRDLNCPLASESPSPLSGSLVSVRRGQRDELVATVADSLRRASGSELPGFHRVLARIIAMKASAIAGSNYVPAALLTSSSACSIERAGR